MAAIELPDGRQCPDFEVGDRCGETFLRLYARLPAAERYYSNDYAVYWSWLPAGRRLAGKGKLANRNEGLHSERRGRQKRLGYATTGTRSGCGACVVRWRCCVCVRGSTKIQCQRVLKNTGRRGVFIAAFEAFTIWIVGDTTAAIRWHLAALVVGYSGADNYTALAYLIGRASAALLILAA